MATFFMFGKYSAQSIKEMKAERTEQAVELIKKYDGKVNAMYALLGEHDLAFIVDFSGVESAMKASIALSKLTGIAFSTSPAVAVAEFDKLMKGF